MLRDINSIRAELEADGLASSHEPITSPWPGFANAGDYIADFVERQAEREFRFKVEVEEFCRERKTQMRIKAELNPVFAKFGLRLTKLPNWGRA